MSPQPPSHGRRWPGWAAFGVLLLWYALTAARGLMWFDSGELALVGQQMGLGHPPGQPLYTLLLAGAARIPGLDPLVAMNLVSALFAAACAVPADALARRLVGGDPYARFGALLAVGALAPVWDQATRIELYAPATLIMLWLLVWGERAVARRSLALIEWLGLGALVGLVAGFNPVFALGGALAVGLHATVRLRHPRLAVCAGAAAIGALLTTTAAYTYAFAVRHAPDALVWGPLDSLADWFAYLGGHDYAHTAHSAWTSAPGHLLDWATWLVGQGALPVVLLGLAGWVVAERPRRALLIWAVPLAVGAAFSFTYAEFHPEVPDYNGYLMPALWLGAVGLVGLLGWVRPTRARIVALALVLSATVMGERPVWHRSRAGLTLPHRLAAAWLDAMPPQALLLVESDHLVFPMFYLQAVQGRRPDVVVFNTGFGASSWYWRWLYRAHPDLPTIPLAAPDTATRVRRLAAASARPVHAESIAWGFRLGAQPCPATWGFRLGAACDHVRDDPAAFHDQLRTAWAGPARHDLITPRVIAAVAHQRAFGLWALGDASGALAALRAGTPEGARLPVPPGLRRPAQAPPLAVGAPTLLGDPLVNRALGGWALQMLGRGEARAWQTED